MIRKTQLRAALIVASSSIMLSACVDQESDVVSQENSTRESALLSAFSVGPTTQTINEGGSASVGVSQLCVNNIVDDVVITANWGDMSATDSRTFPTTGLTAQGGCPANYYEVCGGSVLNSNCAAWTHTYKDNGAGFPVAFVATQGVETSTQNITVVVNNLPPVVDLVRTGAAFEGVDAAFVLGVEDPGLLSTEIAGATWTWTPDSGVNDPTVINCTCANATDCDDGTNLTICGETNGRLTDTKSRIYLDNGNYTLSVVVTDKDGAQTTITRSTTIANLPPENVAVKIDNNAISTNPINPTPLIEGTEYDFLGSLNEQGIDTLTFDWNLGDSTTRTGSALVSKANYPTIEAITPADALSFPYIYDNTPAAISNDYTVSFIASDDDGGAGTRTGYVQVTDVNPVINSFTGNQSVTEGGSVTYTVNAVSGAETASFDPIGSYDWDIDGNGNGSLANNYTVTSGCGTTDTNCVIQFLDGNNSYTVQVDVNDEDSTTSSATRTVTVNNNPVSLSNIPPLAGIFEAGSTTLTYTFADAAGALDGPYSVSVNWGDGTMTPFTTTHTAPGSFTTSAHTYADNGIYTISVQVCEVLDNVGPGPGPGPGMGCDTESTTIVVTNVAPTPSIAAFGPIEEGYAFNLEGTFFDPAGSLDDAYTGVWSGLDVGNQSLTANYATRAADLFVSGGARFTSQGAKTISLKVTDADGGESLVVSTNVNVTDNDPIIDNISQTFVPVLQTDEPAIATLEIDVEAETDDDKLTKVVVNWGDSFANASAAQTAATSTTTFGPGGVSTFTVSASHKYIESGTYTATVTVFDEDSFTTDTIDITVDNVDPTITLVEATPAAPVIVTEGQSFSARITATDPSTVDAQSLSFQTNWGDMSSDFANGSVTVAGTARAQFSHVYTNPGTYTVTMTVTDPDGGFDTSTLTIEVLNRAPTITDVFNTGPVNENTSVTAVMLVNNPGADTLHYSFNFACTKTLAANVDNSDFSEAIPGLGTSAVNSNTYQDQGSNPVCVRVCDDDGPAFGCDYGLTTVTVNNVAPQITGFPAPAPVTENAAGATVVLSATATDVGPLDVLTYSFDCDSNGTEDFSNTTGVASCVYTVSGNYTATVKVSDADGGSAMSTTQVRITNVAPTISSVAGLNVNEGNATTVTITAADIGGDTLSYRFDFNNDGQYDVTKSTNAATWTYPQDGLKTVGVQVCDSKNACVQSSTTLTVANVAPSILSVSTPSSVSRGTAVTAIVDAIDAGNDKLSYTFNFKDSSGATVFAIGPQASNIATATIADSGAYSVDVTVTDTVGAPNTAASATATSNFTVTDISVAINVIANPSTISEGGTTTITVTPSGTGPYLVRYDINGDGDFNDPEDIVPANAADTCVTCSAPGITYANNRAGNLPYRVLVEVTDTGEGNAVATALVSVTVNNVAPTIAAIGDIASAPEQTALAVAIVGTDVGTEDTITYSLVSGPSAITVNPTTGNLSWTPNWTDEGATSITVRATDNDGGKSEETFTVTVTIIDTNNNGISDTRERELNNGNLLPADADTTDSDNDGVSDLQEVLDGTDPNVSDAPSAPLILSPNKESVDTLRPTLTVVNAESPRGLELQYTFVVEDSTGTEITRISGVAEGVNTTSVEVDVDLTEDAVYTWFANADDGFVVGDDSQDGEFRVNTANSAPPVPENLTPLANAILPGTVLAALELRAVVDPDGDAVSYEFEIASEASFTSIVTTSELRTVPFFSLSEVLAPGEYFWHGRATDGTDASAFGTATSFTIQASNTNTAPPAPTIVKPNGVVLATASATLEITGVVDADGDDVEYAFEIADNAAFAGADVSGLQAGLTYAVTGLTEDTTYFWRARSFDGTTTSEWVSAKFAVNAQNAAPTGLAIVSPAPGALLERAPEGLVWADATDADGDELTYTVDLATTADFAEILYTEDFAAGDSVAVPTGVTFDPELTYYWRVTVSDGTDSEEVTGSFDLYSTPVVSAGTGGDDGCGCSSVAKPSSRQPMALIFGLMMAGLLVMRRRKRD